MNWKGFQKKRPWPNWSHNYPRICLAGLRKIMKLLGQDNQCPGYASNWTSPKYHYANSHCVLVMKCWQIRLAFHRSYLFTLWVAWSSSSLCCKGIAKSSPLYLVLSLHSELFHVISSLTCSEYLCPKCLACRTFLRYFLFGSNRSLFLFPYSGFHLSCHTILYTHTVYFISRICLFLNNVISNDCTCNYPNIMSMEA
jgi:hypothetical protein